MSFLRSFFPTGGDSRSATPLGVFVHARHDVVEMPPVMEGPPSFRLLDFSMGLRVAAGIDLAVQRSGICGQVAPLVLLYLPVTLSPPIPGTFAAFQVVPMLEAAKGMGIDPQRLLACAQVRVDGLASRMGVCARTLRRRLERHSIVDDAGALRENFKPRPYPQKVAGTPLSFARDDLGFALRWDNDPAAGNTEVYVPDGMQPARRWMFRQLQTVPHACCPATG